MDNNKVLNELVKNVKDNVKARGGYIRQEEIAAKLGIGRSYLSNLLHGKQSVTSQFISHFRQVFKEYLPDTDAVTRDDLTIINTTLGVIMRALAKMQRKIPTGEDAASYLAGLKLEIELLSVEKKVSEIALKRSLEEL